MWLNPQFPTDLVTFTEEILNGKLYFLCENAIKSAENCGNLNNKVVFFQVQFKINSELFLRIIGACNFLKEILIWIWY